MLNKVLIFLLAFVFIGCNNKQEIYVDNTMFLKNNDISKLNRVEEESLKNDKKLFEQQTSTIQQEYDKFILSKTLKDNALKNKALMDFYHEWKNVRYRLGGNSKRGIDCSAFTQRVFKEKFDVKIPRTTRTQVKVGKRIKKSQLKMGDLVFFKTGKTDRHVGVYMGDGTFMHASIKGVKFTKLNKPFYKRTYWTSRRVIN